MFFGSWKINVTFSVIGFLVVFIGSMATNNFTTSFIRGWLAFVSFYIIAYFFRWLWMIAVANNESKKNQIEHNSEGKDSNNNLNYSEEEIKEASNYVKDLIND